MQTGLLIATDLVSLLHADVPYRSRSESLKSTNQGLLEHKPRQNRDLQQTLTAHARLEASTTNAHLRKNLSPEAVTLSHTTLASKMKNSYRQAFSPYFHAHCYIWKISTPRKTTIYIL
jgi:hypothetical protein